MIVVKKRDGRNQVFDKSKIIKAVLSAFDDVDGEITEYAKLKAKNIADYIENIAKDKQLDIEEIQDLVENGLMSTRRKDVAKAYITYRDLRTRIRGNSIDKQIKEIIEGNNEYWNTENSNKNPQIASTQRDYMAGQISTDLTRRELLPTDVIAAHDAGIIHFHDADYFAQHIFNCFRGDTKFISNKGVKPFCAFKDGENVLVPTHTGEWKKAIVKKYGIQNVNKITLKRGGWTEKIIYATDNHRWILKDGQSTTNLKVGDYLLKTPSIAQYDWEELTQEEKVIWCYGFAYGDGSFHKEPYEYSNIRLCGNKNRYENNFREAGFSVTHPNSFNGDASIIIPGYNKNTIPKNLDEETYKIFIHGLLSADGHRTNTAGSNTKNEFRGIQITGSSKINDISQLLEMAGYYISSEVDLTDQITNYGKRSDTTKSFRIQSEQTYRNWRVTSIEKNVEEVETWCLEVEDNHSFILSGGIVTGNCCLVNLEDMLQNGTVINGTMIEKPHSFSTACNIATQIIAVVASGQYGGQSISLAHLAPFVDISRQKIREEVAYELSNLTDLTNNEDIINKIAEERLKKEIERGVQTIQYQINTLNTSNGQTPFVTVFMYLNEAKSEQEKQDLALIIEEVLKQRYQGTKNEVGVWITPAFPKLIYVLEEDNIHEDSKFYYLTKLAAKCSAKRLVPDYISEKIMKELKEGNCFPVMGCRSALSPWKDENGEYKFYGRLTQKVEPTLNCVNP